MKYRVITVESKGKVKEGEELILDEIFRVPIPAHEIQASLYTGPGFDRVKVKLIAEVDDDYKLPTKKKGKSK